MSFTSGEAAKRAALAHASTSGAEIAATPSSVATVDATAAAAVPLPAFEAAAQHVAEAEAALERAHGVARDKQGRVDKIGARIATLTAERDQIARRRAGGDGDVQSDDPARIAALDLDLHSLAAMRTDAAAALALAQAGLTTAEHHVQNAQDRLKLAEQERQHLVLTQHATRLAALLRETLERLLPLETNLSPSRCWAPPSSLIETLRRSAFSARKGW